MKMLRSHFPIATFLCAAAGFVVGFRALPLLSGGTPGANEQALAPFTDYRHEQPGAIRKITLADLPEPYRTQSADSRPHIVPRPADAWPKALSGFTVTQYVTGFGFVKVKMLPFDNKSEFQVIVDMPNGTTLEETARVT